MVTLTKRKLKLADISIFIIFFAIFGFFFYQTVIGANQQPDMPTNLGPASLVDGSSISSATKLEFNFTISDQDNDNLQYEIQITTAEDLDYDFPLLDFVSDTVSPGSHTYELGLEPEADGYYLSGSGLLSLPKNAYIWRVRGIDTEGLQSEYTEANSQDAAFRIDFPNIPTNLGPEEFTVGGETLDRTPTLTFDLSSILPEGSLGYSITIGNNTTDGRLILYNSPLTERGEASFTVGQAANGGTYRRGGAVTELADGEYYWSVKALDEDENESGVAYANEGETAFIVVSTLTDNEPPIITNHGVETTQNSITFSWRTNETATTELIYDVTEDLSYADSVEGMTDQHEITLSGLEECTYYYYSIISEDENGNRTIDEQDVAMTEGCPGDSFVTYYHSRTLGPEGGTVDMAEDETTIIILDAPENFSDVSTSFQILKLDKETVLTELSTPSSYSSVGDYVFNIQTFEDPTSRVHEFEQPISITISYTDEDVGSLTESAFKIYRNDNDSWTQLSNCAVEAEDNEITCETNHFSIFSLFGQTAQAGGGTGGGTTGSGGGVVIIPSPTKPMANNPNTSSTTQNDNTNTTSASSIFLKNLSFGMKDADVARLQAYLNKHGFPVSTNGAGAAGKETTFFGVLTRAALIKFQEANKDAILKPFGIEKGTGFFGEKSREYINSH